MVCVGIWTPEEQLAVKCYELLLLLLLLHVFYTFKPGTLTLYKEPNGCQQLLLFYDTFILYIETTLNTQVAMVKLKTRWI